MSNPAARRFVTVTDSITEQTAFTLNAWLSRPDVVPCQDLLLVRATMEPGRCHPFHHHPTREEIIYVISGQAEQWVGRETRRLGAGDIAHIPKDEVHGTYNAGNEALVILAILSPARFEGPALVDVSMDEPWSTLRS